MPSHCFVGNPTENEELGLETSIAPFTRGEAEMEMIFRASILDVGGAIEETLETTDQWVERRDAYTSFNTLFSFYAKGFF